MSINTNEEKSPNTTSEQIESLRKSLDISNSPLANEQGGPGLREYLTRFHDKHRFIVLLMINLQTICVYLTYYSSNQMMTYCSKAIFKNSEIT